MSTTDAPGYEIVIYRAIDIRTDDSPREQVDRVLCTRRALSDALLTLSRDYAVPWEQVPATNRALMVATCAAVLRAVLPGHDAALAERIALAIEATNHQPAAGCECDAQDAQAIAAAIARAHATPPEEPDNAQ